MCSAKPPKAPEIKLPQYMTNPFLDAERGGMASTVAAPAGGSALTIPKQTGLGIGFTGRNISNATTGTLGIQGNRRVNQGNSLTNTPLNT